MPPEENGWFSNDFLESNYYYYYDLKNINRPPSASFAEKKKIKISNVLKIIWRWAVAHSTA
jgi:hypothetical protein